MPIFEYLCRTCNRIYSFLSLSPRPDTAPACPKCAATDLVRVPSTFAVASSGKGKPEPAAGGAATGPDDAAMSRLEHEVMHMADSLDEKDAEDPRVMARMMRRLAEVSGEPVTPAMSEMFRRMEAGEDPEALEEELGPQLEAEMGGEGEEEGGLGGAPTRDDGLYSM
ncbi:MAG TPA: zinc ribbon domain-containing protein [Thermoanaerobaculaceae bacterium]|nr:zinc ribbon domain-containing protein [Thermoanaerobaculaceae bacterium]HRS16479.1 zinc ribbon domain-containing protein [Thermoanaerobaculaceae bacterium]